MATQKSRIQLIKHELKEHLPFTLLGVAASILILFLLDHFSLMDATGSEHHHAHHHHDHDEGAHCLGGASYYGFFHVAHFGHIFLSSIVSAAIYLRRSGSYLKSTLVAIISSILFCSLSDILIPFLGGHLWGMQLEFHTDLIEAPFWVILSALIGAILGIIAEKKFGRISYFTHGSHVFVSSLASLFYLVAFGLTNWTGEIIGVFIITTLAVVLPCCSSDIIFPMSFVGGIHGHEHEDEHTHH